jgi:hypothetical protein
MTKKNQTRRAKKAVEPKKIFQRRRRRIKKNETMEYMILCSMAAK